MTEDFATEYGRRRAECFAPLAGRLETFLADALGDMPRVDRITARAKSVDRFVDKALKIEKGVPKYADPLKQIQDQVGARVVTFYLDDVEVVARRVDELFVGIEAKSIVPERDSEFGYFGVHRILFVPRDVIVAGEGDPPPFFELQIKTLFQHAWGEADHDLGYKPEGELDSKFKRKIAFTSAQAWGADEIFNDLVRSRNCSSGK